MLTPAAKVELGIGAGGALVDVSSRLLAFETARGRQDELSAIDTGTARVRLDNSDRALEPEYTGSPYYPNVEPDAELRISATWSGTSYPIFTGVVGDLAVTRRSTVGAFVEIPAVDAFERLNAARFSQAFAGGDYSGARVGSILDAIGDSGARSLEAGQSIIAAETVTDGTGLATIQAVAGYELGAFFIAADGTRTFQDRHHRLLVTTPRYTFGDDPAGGEIPYTAAPPAMLKQEIVNSWTISDSASHTELAEDSASITKRGLRSKSRTANLYDPLELRAQAHFLLSRYLAPALRIRELSLHGDAVTFQAMLALELGDRVKTIQRPAGGGAAIDRDGYVERIAITHERGIRWSASVKLSPASQFAYWLAGVSHAGVDTRAAY